MGTRNGPFADAITDVTPLAAELATPLLPVADPIDSAPEFVEAETD
jgi:hypothetical protein